MIQSFLELTGTPHASVWDKALGLVIIAAVYVCVRPRR